MNVTQMNFSTKIDRIAAIKAQIEALQSESDTLVEKDNIAVGRAVDTDLETGKTSEPVSVVLVG